MQGLVTQSVIGLVASVSLDSGGMCGSSLWFSKNGGGGGGGGGPIPTAVLKLPSPPARIVVGASNDPWEVWQLVAPKLACWQSNNCI